ncbi:IclR family transcriptional regulator domain-containing protein [Microbacterium luticocti]|uniref:IclR family transcriptional regulator domain-containing protein n=1 Tax=Microbacterium luticocti TaxID=451764 RepID=UPI0003FA6DAE|nr:IclR family transcriptional regulator C-terminal domain-containing protein [Microbacterium luticocti]
MSGEPEGGGGRDFIQSIDRAFAVLRCFSLETPEPTLGEVAEHARLDRAAARRYLLTLERLGYVGKRGSRFHLRPRILELGYSYLSSLSLPRLAQPFLVDLATRCEESCSLTVLDGTEIAYVAVANAVRGLSITLTVGNRLPAYCTAAGRALLSGLGDDAVREVLTASGMRAHTATTVWDVDAVLTRVRAARERGWCVVDQELEDGVRSVSVPVHGRDGSVVAAATVSVPSSRISTEALAGEIREMLQQTVAQLETSTRDAPVRPPVG